MVILVDVGDSMERGEGLCESFVGLSREIQSQEREWSKAGEMLRTECREGLRRVNAVSEGPQPGKNHLQTEGQGMAGASWGLKSLCLHAEPLNLEPPASLRSQGDTCRQRPRDR